ncbi:protein TsetseEP-like [Dermacentor albipictus]|uniref:protein TsetseEP-like n=1 Tax=Dermacentor albipictus TaxID=60249 RepID=UPI0031FCBD2B
MLPTPSDFKNADASVDSALHPTTPPPLPPKPGGVESKGVPHNTNTEAWPALPKRQPPPQLKLQPKQPPGPQPMAQLKPQLKPQSKPEVVPQPKPQPEPRPMPQPISQPESQPDPRSHQRIQRTAVESTAPTPDKLYEEDRQLEVICFGPS